MVAAVFPLGALQAQSTSEAMSGPEGIGAGTRVRGCWFVVGWGHILVAASN
jgi:hypothetical protein